MLFDVYEFLPAAQRLGHKLEVKKKGSLVKKKGSFPEFLAIFTCNIYLQNFRKIL